MDSRFAKFLLAIVTVLVLWFCMAVAIIIMVIAGALITFLPLVALINPDVVKLEKGKITI